MTETALIKLPLDNVPAEIANMAREVAARMAEGKTLTRACKDMGIRADRVHGWKYEYQEVAEFFAYVDELWAHAKADELAELAESGMNAQVMRTHADSIKWLLARKARRHYGDDAAKQPADNNALVEVLREAVQRIPRPSEDLPKIINAQRIDNKHQLDSDTVDE